MSLIDTVKRINVDEFKPEDRETMEKLAEIYNDFSEQVTNAINGNLDFSNLNRAFIEITVSVDSNGTPTQKTQFSSKTGLRGISTLNATNTTNSSVYPTSSPFIIFTSNGQGLYTIQRVLGLVAGNKFNLALELIF